MPALPRLTRVVRLATLPETRGLIILVAQSKSLRGVARRAIRDPGGVAREMRPANARALVRGAVRHPAARELANVGLVFLPARFLPLGWAATWAARRLLHRYVDQPAEAAGAEPAGPPISPPGAQAAGGAPGDGIAGRDPEPA